MDNRHTERLRNSVGCAYMLCGYGSTSESYRAIPTHFFYYVNREVYGSLIRGLEMILLTLCLTYKCSIMRKYFLLLLLLLSTITYAQKRDVYFELTPDGFVNVEDKSNFCIIQTDKKAEDMYNDVLLSLGRLYKSPKDVISTVENKQITINAILTQVTTYKWNFANRCINAHYQLIIEFKDNRVRVFAPLIHKLFEPEYGHELLGICRKISASTQSKSQTIWGYKKKELRNEKAKIDIENSFNSHINELLFSDKNEATNDDNW